MTTGILKACFQYLLRYRVTPDRACDIIVAFVVLHNIATIKGERCPTINDGPDEDYPYCLAELRRRHRLYPNVLT